MFRRSRRRIKSLRSSRYRPRRGKRIRKYKAARGGVRL